ncbi:hypothetical protein AMTR_s00020p00221480 [Amborella trichopoda]|uniref:Uncharacterized protein n=1 Tax=Amborella trichopoda TaxID=13333 RepID=W1PV07_AMBTC|nr:hypothetical protein AMTR_s00020p00221480 [Amborella trichopoda]
MQIWVLQEGSTWLHKVLPYPTRRAATRRSSGGAQKRAMATASMAAATCITISADAPAPTLMRPRSRLMTTLLRTHRQNKIMATANMGAATCITASAGTVALTQMRPLLLKNPKIISPTSLNKSVDLSIYV